MKYLISFLFIVAGQRSFAQDNKLLAYKKHFDQELKQWKNSFTNFSLANFQVHDSSHFDDNNEQDFNSYKTFLSRYKPIVTYSPDSSKFIDIYSYQLNLEKKGNYYYGNPDIDQAIFLYDPKRKYWKSIYFGTNSQWIDEVIWTSKTKFILVGITKSVDDKKIQLILLGDTNKQILTRYLSDNKS